MSRKSKQKETEPEVEVLATLSTEQLSALQRRQAILRFARDRAFEAAELRFLAEEGYIAHTETLRDELGLPTLFNVDMASGVVTAVDLPDAEEAPA